MLYILMLKKLLLYVTAKNAKTSCGDHQATIQ